MDYASSNGLTFRYSVGHLSNRDFEFGVPHYTLVFGVIAETCRQKLWNLVRFHEEVHTLVMK